MMYESRCTKEYYTTFVTKPTYNLFIVHCYAVVDLMMVQSWIECVCCWLLLNHHTLFTPLSSLLSYRFANQKRWFLLQACLLNFVGISRLFDWFDSYPTQLNLNRMTPETMTSLTSSVVDPEW